MVGDPDRLQQVVWNLVSNAVKFTPEGGRVEVALAPGGRPRPRIAVADTGKGIAADFLPHVFERFRQADSTSTRAYGGLGLGLAIVRHLVELHGGTVARGERGRRPGRRRSPWSLPVSAATGARAPRAGRRAAHEGLGAARRRAGAGGGRRGRHAATC